MSEYLKYVPPSESNNLPEVRSPIVEARFNTVTPKEDRLNKLTSGQLDFFASVLS